MQYPQRIFVFLAYLDDCGFNSRKNAYRLMTAVVIPDRAFRETESLAATSLVLWPPLQQMWSRFQEFKAHELFGGRGPFEGIDQDIRFELIGFLLEIVNGYKFPVIFGALDVAEWEKQKSKSGPLYAYGSANELDICFRICMKGVNDFVAQNWPQTFAVLISDEANKDKAHLRQAFYEYSERAHAPADPTDPLKDVVPYLHDDMYFGDSKYSVGIQLADLCGFFIEKHLRNDPSSEGFYSIIKNQVMYSRIEPQGQVVHPETVAPVFVG